VERIHQSDKIYIIGYHTQECRFNSQPLEEPIKCKGRNAWLGVGYYFWTDIEFAHYWGIDFKSKATGYYDIYKARLDTDKCINAVFDEDGYFFLKQSIEDTISHFEKNGLRITLEAVNRFLADNIWKQIGIEGIIYDDKPTNPSYKENRVYSEIPDLYYKKRIQIVLFNLKNVRNFAVHLESKQEND
jgi:hypothetical protein